MLWKLNAIKGFLLFAIFRQKLVWLIYCLLFAIFQPIVTTKNAIKILLLFAILVGSYIVL